MFKSLYKKCLDLAAHKSSKYYLAIVSFVESSFFPIPPDVMVIPMVISKKNDFIKIFLITTIFSVLGGMLGYLIGAFFFEFGAHIMSFYGYEDKLSKIKESLVDSDSFYAWSRFIEYLKILATVFLTMAMAAVGISINLSELKSMGYKPFVVGFIAAVTVGVISLIYIETLKNFLI